MSTPRKQWNPDSSEKEVEEGQKKDKEQQRSADPRERPELYKPNARVVTSDPGRSPKPKDD